MKLLEAIKWKARKDALAFVEDDGSNEIVSHYERIRADLSSLGASLKAAVKLERREKDDLAGDEEVFKRHKYFFFFFSLDNYYKLYISHIGQF